MRLYHSILIEQTTTDGLLTYVQISENLKDGQKLYQSHGLQEEKVSNKFMSMLECY